MNKRVLRMNLIAARKKIHDKHNKSMVIINKIIKMDKYLNSNVIALYNSLKDEVNLDYLINYSLNCGKTVLLPRVVDNNLVFIKIDSSTKYEKSNFNVLEPLYDKEKVYNDIIGLIIVPGVGFDIENNRIGYGKGYYDRFLLNKDIYKVGVCFDEQLINNIVVDNNDIKMNIVLTDKLN